MKIHGGVLKTYCYVRYPSNKAMLMDSRNDILE